MWSATSHPPLASRCAAVAVSAEVTADTLTVELADGRSVSVPTPWYPRLSHGTPEERANWRLIGAGEGLHWEELDEDISAEGLLAGHPPGESAASLERWLRGRAST